MAVWPLSRFQAFVANVTIIRKAFLDAVQDAIVSIFTGALSLQALTVDATGATPTSPTPGTIVASGGIASVAGSITAILGNLVATAGDVIATAGKLTAGLTKAGTSKPTAATVIGSLYKDNIPIAWGVFQNGGAITFNSGFNISNVVRNSPGNVTVTLVTAAPNSLCPIGVVSSAGGGFEFIKCVPNNASSFAILTQNSADTTPTDVDVCFVVFGR